MDLVVRIGDELREHLHATRAADADLVALFQHFSFKDALREMIQRTGGLIYQTDVSPERQPATNGALIQAELSTANPLVQLAKQFGEAMGMRKALRSFARTTLTRTL